MRNPLIRKYILSLRVTTGKTKITDLCQKSTDYDCVLSIQVSGSQIFLRNSKKNKTHEFKLISTTHAHTNKHLETNLKLQFYTFLRKNINAMKNKEKFYSFFVTSCDDLK